MYVDDNIANYRVLERFTLALELEIIGGGHEKSVK